jgi:thiol:disulfide interchange protein DsbD
MDTTQKQRWKQLGQEAGVLLFVCGLIWVLTLVFLEEPLWRIVGLILLIGGIFVGVGSTRPFPTRYPRILKWSVTVLFVAFSLWVQSPPKPEAQLVWEPYSVAAIEQAARDGKPVIIDFYADWCPPCRELDARVFSREAVVNELDRFVRLRADLTDQNSLANAKISERHSVAAFPTVAFFGSDGRERYSMRLLGYESPTRFLSRARAIK